MNFEEHCRVVPESKTTVLRPYRLDDIPVVCAAVQKYLPELPHYKDIKVSPARIDYLMRQNYGNSGYFQSWVLCDSHDIPVGGGAGYCTPGMVTWDLVANDVFLFVLPNWRSLDNVNKLMNAYKQWALARGAVLITASQTGGFRADKMDIIMRRHGYVNVGSNYHLRTDEAYLSKQLRQLKG